MKRAAIFLAFRSRLVRTIRVDACLAELLVDDLLGFFRTKFAYLAIHSGYQYHYFLLAAAAERAAMLSGFAALNHGYLK